MEKRPRSLSIIGWWLALTAIHSLYGALTPESSPMVLGWLATAGVPETLYRSMNVVDTIVLGVCGYGILFAQPWSRVLYVVENLLSIAAMIFIIPMTSAVAKVAIGVEVFMFLLIGYFLFRPTADRWFNAQGFQILRAEA